VIVCESRDFCKEASGATDRQEAECFVRSGQQTILSLKSDQCLYAWYAKCYDLQEYKITPRLLWSTKLN